MAGNEYFAKKVDPLLLLMVHILFHLVGKECFGCSPDFASMIVEYLLRLSIFLGNYNKQHSHVLEGLKNHKYVRQVEDKLPCHVVEQIERLILHLYDAHEVKSSCQEHHPEDVEQDADAHN